MDKKEIDEWLNIIENDPMFNPPEEAVEAYPDECAHCGVEADPFWIPEDFEEGDDPGTCTECWNHFGGWDKDA